MTHTGESDLPDYILLLMELHVSPHKSIGIHIYKFFKVLLLLTRLRKLWYGIAWLHFQNMFGNYLTNKICIHIPDNYFSNKCKTNSTIIITCML